MGSESGVNKWVEKRGLELGTKEERTQYTDLEGGVGTKAVGINYVPGG